MIQKTVILFLSLIVLTACSGPKSVSQNIRPLEGINITIDPGHGRTEAYDDFRVGPRGEREEWINLRVAKALAFKLKMAGANVFITRTKDRDVSLGGRATLAKRHNSDLFVSIHHNGSGNDSGMDLPIVYFYGSASQNPASVDFAKILIKGMREKLEFEQPEAGAVYSDHLIYSSGVSILRNTIDSMPAVIGEAGFFTNPEGEERLMSRGYNLLEADVYYEAILEYFDNGTPSAAPMVEDSLRYLKLNQPLEFQLDDGFGSNFFEENTFEAYQESERIEAVWHPGPGILSVTPIETEEKTVTFKVFGRNFKGNALHPIPFTFLTKKGYDWNIHEGWQAAFDEAELNFNKFTKVQTDTSESAFELLETSLHLYQLSLELQIVHPRARAAEEKILTLLERKQEILGSDESEAIAAQRLRLKEYYPE